MSSAGRSERRAAIAAVLLPLLVGACLLGVAHLVGAGDGPAPLAERSRWLDEPLQPPPDTPERQPIDARDGVASRYVTNEVAASADAKGQPDVVEAHDLAVPRHALLVDERELRRSVAELETLDSQGTAARDTLLSARARLLSRAEAMERATRSLRFVQEP